MGAILGGLFNSRLNMKLREEKGYTYGAGAGLRPAPRAGPFAARAAVNTEVTVPALTELLASWTGSAGRRSPTQELRAARDYLVGVFPLRFETPGPSPARSAGLFIHGLPDDELERYRPAIEAVTADDVQRVAREHIRPEAAAIVLVGDADAFGEALDGAGVGDVEVIRDEVDAAADGRRDEAAAARRRGADHGPGDPRPRHPSRRARRPAGSSTRLPALASPTFRRFLTGAVIGRSARFMQQTAQGWLVLELTDSPAALGIGRRGHAAAAPVLDPRRRPRRPGRPAPAARLDPAVRRGACALVLAILTTTGVVQYWHVLVLAFLAGTASAIQLPASQAVVSTLVDRAAIGIGRRAQLRPVQPGPDPGAGDRRRCSSPRAACSSRSGSTRSRCVLVARDLHPAHDGPAARRSPSVQASMWSNLVDGIRYVRGRRIIAVLVLLAGVPAVFLLNYLVCCRCSRATCSRSARRASAC